MRHENGQGVGVQAGPRVVELAGPHTETQDTALVDGEVVDPFERGSDR
ncbi:hypothetical protein [Cellulomonas sp. KH9]|nr:hypothetical protein [Cellulomonas sp. KH9]